MPDDPVVTNASAGVHPSFCVAIGLHARVGGNTSFALGDNTTAIGDYVIDIGPQLHWRGGTGPSHVMYNATRDLYYDNMERLRARLGWEATQAVYDWMEVYWQD